MRNDQGLVKNPSILQRIFTDPYLCPRHRARHCREPTGQKCIPSRALHSTGEIRFLKIHSKIDGDKYCGGKWIREGGYKVTDTLVETRGRDVIFNGVIRECFSEKVMCELSPKGGEEAGMRPMVTRRRASAETLRARGPVALPVGRAMRGPVCGGGDSVGEGQWGSGGGHWGWCGWDQCGRGSVGGTSGRVGGATWRNMERDHRDQLEPWISGSHTGLFVFSRWDASRRFPGEDKI